MLRYRQLKKLYRQRKRFRALVAGLLAALLLLPLPVLAGAPENGVTVDAMEYPFSAIGRVNVAGRGHCTGFLVAPAWVMTAAHCLYNAKAGRWWAPGDIHFVAGYQRDRNLIHAPAKAFFTAAGFVFKRRPKLGDEGSDWALLELTKEIGREAGTLPLAWLSKHELIEIRDGKTRLAKVGYSANLAHVQSVDAPCKLLRVYGDSPVVVDDCGGLGGDSGGPLLVYRDGAFRVVGVQAMTLNLDGKAVGGSVSMLAITRAEKDDPAKRAARRAGLRSGKYLTPGEGSRARAIPGESIAAVLKRRGLTGKGRPSLALLAQLLGMR